MRPPGLGEYGGRFVEQIADNAGGHLPNVLVGRAGRPHQTSLISFSLAASSVSISLMY
jgi:hypothetical protein